MHELIYLSESKIAQFASSEGRWRRRPRKYKLGLDVSIAKAEFESDGDTSDSIDKRTWRVVDNIRKSTKWYTEDRIQSGQWIDFEVRMHYYLMDEVRRHNESGEFRQSIYLPSAVLFLDFAGDCNDTPRLLLHGSISHVLEGRSSPPPVPASMPVTTINLASRSSYTTILASQAHFFTNHIEDAARTHLFATDEAFQFPMGELTRGERGVESLGVGLTEAIHRLDRLSTEQTVSWMAGLARVTAVVDGLERDTVPLVAATPLFVERVPPPDTDQGG
jgi:hypothetical protein